MYGFATSFGMGTILDLTEQEPFLEKDDANGKENDYGNCWLHRPFFCFLPDRAGNILGLHEARRVWSRAGESFARV